MSTPTGGSSSCLGAKPSSSREGWGLSVPAAIVHPGPSPGQLGTRLWLPLQVHCGDCNCSRIWQLSVRRLLLRSACYCAIFLCFIAVHGNFSPVTDAPKRLLSSPRNRHHSHALLCNDSFALETRLYSLLSGLRDFILPLTASDDP